MAEGGIFMKQLKAMCIYLLLCGYLGVHHGYVALFESNRPVQVFPYAVQDYSPADQDSLKKGIPFRSNEEKQRLMENYLS